MKHLAIYVAILTGQKPLPTKWGVVDGYRVRTGQTYCGEFCAADDELRVFNEAQKQ